MCQSKLLKTVLSVQGNKPVRRPSILDEQISCCSLHRINTTSTTDDRDALYDIPPQKTSNPGGSVKRGQAALCNEIVLGRHNPHLILGHCAGIVLSLV